jgi:hypothetical protein
MLASRELQYKPVLKALRRYAEGLFGVVGVVVRIPGCYWLRSLEEFEAPLLNPKQNPPVPRLIHEITIAR